MFGCCSVCVPSTGSSATVRTAPAVAGPTSQASGGGSGRADTCQTNGAASPKSPKSPAAAVERPRSPGGANRETTQKQLMPYKRQRSRARGGGNWTSEMDGGTGGLPAGQDFISATSVGLGSEGEGSKACRAMLNYSRSRMSSDSLSPSALPSKARGKFKRYDSQLDWNKAEQVIIVFDWDDTLFPTTFVQDDLELNWQLPLSQQRLAPPTLQSIQAKLASCEERAVDTLEKACDLGHVVIVTLASTGWVDMACKHFYPAAGKVLEARSIKVVHAQEKVMKGGTKHYDKEQFKSNEELERFWGLVKGQAISEEVEAFYSQYEGQSWKNILSIGDSCFERYGLLAATSAYMQDKKVNHAEANQPVWMPTEEGKWSKETDGKNVKVRAKVCKLVDQPDVDELIIQLEMITKWLDAMVNLDDGFDLDLEVLDTEDQVEVIESVLRGDLPASQLPKPPPVPDQ